METLPYASAWPAEWTGQRRSGLALFSTVFLGLIALGLAAGALWQITAGEPLGALVFAALAVYSGHLAAIGLQSYRGGRRRSDTTGVREGAEGLVFRYAPGPTYLLTAFLALNVLGLAALAVLAAAQGDTQGYVTAAVLGVMAIFLVVFLAVVLRLAPGRVVVGPDGFHHRGLTFTHFVPWDAVVDVAALWSGGPIVFVRTIASSGTVTHNYLGRDTPGPRTLSPFDTISGRWLEADPGLLLTTLAHYIVHPADRRELGSGAALRRIASS